MTKEKIYITNIVLAAGLIIFSLLLKIQWLIYIGLAILVLSALSKLLAEWIAKSWLALGKLLGAINSKIILSLFFILILVPTSLLRKILSKSTSNKQSSWQVQKKEDFDFTKPW
jgi:hypothetical protein